MRTAFSGPTLAHAWRSSPAPLRPHSASLWRIGITLVLCVLLSACGGGDETQEPPAPAPPPVVTGPGALESVHALGVIAVQDIAAALAEEDTLIQQVTPRYAVQTHRIEYRTTDANGQEVIASGLASVPIKPAGMRSPVLSYQHGTLFRNDEAPSNQAVPSEVAVVLASLGYIVLAPDYVGFGSSRGATSHPYLLAEPSAAATRDLLTAAQLWRQQAAILDNGQLFLTGYSQGGHVTLATQRALQQSRSPHLSQLQMTVVGAGPYDVQATLDGLVDVVRQENALLGALINPGFLRYLGGSVQREVRRLLLRALMPSDADVVYDTRFIDYFLADDVAALDQISNVHDWRPSTPIRFYHGLQDRTVPYASSASTVQAMQRRGADVSLVQLTQCPAQPSGHLECVVPFMSYLLQQLAPVAQDL